MIYLRYREVQKVFRIVNYYLGALYNRGIQVTLVYNDICVIVELTMIRDKVCELSMGFVPKGFEDKFEFLKRTLEEICEKDPGFALRKAVKEYKKKFKY